jgi:hypothetical protein
VDRNDLGLLSRYPAAPRRLLTVDEYHRMGEADILTDDDRVELIEGELPKPRRTFGGRSTPDPSARMWHNNLSGDQTFAAILEQPR